MPNSNILMYTTEDGLTKIEATFDNDTVWLSIDQMAELFQRDRSVIGKHVRNIFKEGELDRNSVWAKFAYTASDGKDYNVDYYNLDVIISVGYRVKSLRGTQFRIWANGVLISKQVTKDGLTAGYLEHPAFYFFRDFVLYSLYFVLEFPRGCEGAAVAAYDDLLDTIAGHDTHMIFPAVIGGKTLNVAVSGFGSFCIYYMDIVVV